MVGGGVVGAAVVIGADEVDGVAAGDELLPETDPVTTVPAVRTAGSGLVDPLRI